MPKITEYLFFCHVLFTDTAYNILVKLYNRLTNLYQNRGVKIDEQYDVFPL